MEFVRFPSFFGNKRASGMEIGNFRVVSKTFVMKRFARNGTFSMEWSGNGLEREVREFRVLSKGWIGAGSPR